MSLPCIFVKLLFLKVALFLLTGFDLWVLHVNGAFVKAALVQIVSRPVLQTDPTVLVLAAFACDVHAALCLRALDTTFWTGTSVYCNPLLVKILLTLLGSELLPLGHHFAFDRTVCCPVALEAGDEVTGRTSGVDDS